jgi:hypothetical protein
MGLFQGEMMQDANLVTKSMVIVVGFSIHTHFHPSP